jgi:hypothetical protein
VELTEGDAFRTDVATAEDILGVTTNVGDLGSLDRER